MHIYIKKDVKNTVFITGRSLWKGTFLQENIIKKQLSLMIKNNY